MKNGAKTVGTFPNRETQFSSENQPEGRGRPKGSISLSTRIQRLLEGEEELPKSIIKQIKKDCGDRKALDAIILAGVMRALWGDEKWAKLLWEMGYGKAEQRTELTGKGGGPLTVSIGWESADK